MNIPRALLVAASVATVSGCATTVSHEQLATESTEWLCSQYRNNEIANNNEVFEEVKRRGVLRPEVAQSVMDSHVLLGLTKEEAICAWGSPKRVNVIDAMRGRHEAWFYLKGRVLHFEGDKLVAIEE